MYLTIIMKSQLKLFLNKLFVMVLHGSSQFHSLIFQYIIQLMVIEILSDFGIKLDEVEIKTIILTNGINLGKK